MRGFIYVLSNPELSGLLKIGKTSKDPKNRSDDLYSTGLPAPFKLEYMAFCDDMDALELRVHEKLAGHRPNLDREFFKISCLSAVNTIRNESKQFGGLLFEEKKFKSAEEFWQLAQRLHQENVQNSVYNKLQLAVQKPSSKEHIRIDPPKSRPVNFGQDYEDYARFEDDVIWSVYEWFAPVIEGEVQRSFDEQSFEEEINNNFARVFPNNPQGQWVLGSTWTSYSGTSVFTAADPNEPYWHKTEGEIITWTEYLRKVKSKTTKVDIEQKRQEEAKQQRLNKKRLFEERREQERRNYEKKQSRSDTIFLWFFGLIILFLLITGGR